METILELGEKFPMAGEYLLNIFLIERDYRQVTNSHLATRMGVSRPAVTQAVKRLENLELLRHEQSHYLLSDRGREFAVCLLRRHYLVEHLLVNTLGYPWDQADEEAHLLQDKISPEFTEFLFDKMGKPQTCPHGNPFPDTQMESKLLGARELTQFSLGSELRVLRITEEGEEVPGLLHACYTNDIRPGSRLRMEQKEDDRVYLTDLRKEKEIVLSTSFASYIRVEHLDN